MVWIWIHGIIPFTNVLRHSNNSISSRTDAFIDVNKITSVFGWVEVDIKSSNDELFIIESIIKISCEGLLFPIPILSHSYHFKRPGYFKRIKDIDKLNNRLDIWKKDEISKIKRKNTDLVIKTLEILDRLKKTSQYHHAPYDLSNELLQYQ